MNEEIVAGESIVPPITSSIINEALSQNVKRLRAMRKLTLDQFSEVTGVSKSVLSQLENGIGNPTFSTIWKISNGLKVPLTSLISNVRPESQVIGKEDVSTYKIDNSLGEIVPFFPFTPERNFEIYFATFEPGGSVRENVHPVGSQEYLLVTSGELLVKCGNESFAIPKGHAFSFPGDKIHSYYNIGNDITSFVCITQYREIL